MDSGIEEKQKKSTEGHNSMSCMPNMHHDAMQHVQTPFEDLHPRLTQSQLEQQRIHEYIYCA